jgi:hypothetical protein
MLRIALKPSLILPLVLFKVPSVPFGQMLTLRLSSGSGAPGAAVSLNITLSSYELRRGPVRRGSDQPAGLQWTLNYSGVDFTAVQLYPGPAATAAGKQIYCATGSGSTTCLIAGLNANQISNGVVATASFQISPTTTSAMSPIQVVNPVAVSSVGSALPIRASGGGVTISLEFTPKVRQRVKGPSTLAESQLNGCLKMRGRSRSAMVP